MLRGLMGKGTCASDENKRTAFGQDHHRHHHLLPRHRSYERRRQRKQHAGEQLKENERKGRAVKIAPRSRSPGQKKKRRGPTGASKKLASSLRL